MVFNAIKFNILRNFGKFCAHNHYWYLLNYAILNLVMQVILIYS